MLRPIRILAPVALAFLAYISFARTPNPSTWTREVLLGANDQIYISYIFEHKNPGSYYEFTERQYLTTFDATTGSIVEQHLLRETLHRDTTTLGDWARWDTVHKTIDVGQYLAEQKAGLAFRDDMGTVEATEEGVFLRLGDRRAPLVSADDLKKVLANPPGPVRFVEQYTAPSSDYRFLLIVSGYGADQDAASRIVPVSEDEFMEAQRRLREQIDTRMGKEIPAKPSR